MISVTRGTCRHVEDVVVNLDVGDRCRACSRQDAGRRRDAAWTPVVVQLGLVVLDRELHGALTDTGHHRLRLLAASAPEMALTISSSLKGRPSYLLMRS